MMDVISVGKKVSHEDEERAFKLSISNSLEVDKDQTHFSLSTFRIWRIPDNGN